MKSPAQLAQQLARQWRSPDLRERRILGPGNEWPIVLSIGIPASSMFSDLARPMREHLNAWRAMTESGPGEVLWQSHKYRAGATPIDVPVSWKLSKPSDWLAAADDAQMRKEYAWLQSVLGEVAAPLRSVVVRRLSLTQDLQPHEFIAAARIAMHLAPGSANGMPLRTLALEGNDSKFFERHEGLLKVLLDQRFSGEATRQGLHAFLGARRETEHWLLIVPLAPGLMDFPRLRLAASDLRAARLPASRILVVENEQALHLLPPEVPDTIAILGAGLDLEWLAAPWLQGKQVAYWGDMDSWGLYMLGRARTLLPGLAALMMDRQVFDAHARHAVVEAVHAPQMPASLSAAQKSFYAFLLSQAKGRLEQEFVAPDCVAQALVQWLDSGR